LFSHSTYTHTERLALRTISAVADDRWKYFRDVGLWPLVVQLDPRGWLENFTPAETPHAIRLLEGFTYFSNSIVEQLFRASFLQASQLVVQTKGNYLAARTEWSDFLNDVYVVRVTGEIPNDTDSGFAFARLARDILQVPQERILSPEAALAKLHSGLRGKIIFVDDFIGSGRQFITMWGRFMRMANSGSFESFSRLAKPNSGSMQFIYCSCIATSAGKEAIRSACPEVVTIAAHTLDSRNSVLSNNSDLWREDMAVTGPEWVESASRRAGILDLGGAEGDWRGFDKLGLALAFAHGYPDATIPLLSWDKAGWKPLLRKGTL